MHRGFVLCTAYEVEKLKEVMSVFGIKEKFTVIGLQTDAQIIPCIVFTLEETKTSTEGEVLLRLLFR